MQLELGSGQVLLELDAALPGAAVDAALEVDAKFPQAEHQKRLELKGNTGHFTGH